MSLVPNLYVLQVLLIFPLSSFFFTCMGNHFKKHPIFSKKDERKVFHKIVLLKTQKTKNKKRKLVIQNGFCCVGKT